MRKLALPLLLLLSCATVPARTEEPRDPPSEEELIAQCWDTCLSKGMNIRDVTGGVCRCTRAGQ